MTDATRRSPEMAPDSNVVNLNQRLEDRKLDNLLRAIVIGEEPTEAFDESLSRFMNNLPSREERTRREKQSSIIQIEHPEDYPDLANPGTVTQLQPKK